MGYQRICDKCGAIASIGSTEMQPVQVQLPEGWRYLGLIGEGYEAWKPGVNRWDLCPKCLEQFTKWLKTNG